MKFDAEKERSTGRAASTGVIPGDVAISVGNPNLPLPDGWRWRPISEVARLESGHTPSRRHPEYWGGPIPWIGIRDATENHGRTISATAQYTNQLGIDNSSARVLPTHTVCLSRTASVGYVVVMGCPMATSQDFVNWVCGPDLDYRFLKYALLAERNSFHRFAHGSTHQTIYFPEVKAFHIAFPPRDLQARIADVLGSIDDRIEHNRALAANLEAIARALFKSWFVDFDPVRAKVAGETPPGLAPDLAALFPDRFVDSELGEIPNGWQVVPLSQLVEVERGLSYKGSGLADRDSGKPMHNLNSVLEGGGYKYAGIKYYSGDYKARHIAKAGDIVVANTEQGHKHLLIGFPAIIPASHAEGLFSHHLYRVRLSEGAGATKHWLYYALMAPEVREQIIGHANGSTVNMLKPTGLQVPLVVLPPMALYEQFDALAESVRARIENCAAESTTLAELRDLLLPRLISGKLRVEDAEAALEAA